MKRKKVLLINPELPEDIFRTFRVIETGHPLGIAYIGAVLEASGVEVRVLENYLLNKPHAYALEVLKEFPADVVGIACTTATFRPCMETARLIKERHPGKTVVCGGPHPTLFPRQMLATGVFDAVTVGESEYSFRDLVLSGGRDEWAKVKGVVYARGGEFVNTGAAVPPADLDALPMPARHLLPMDLYPKTIELLDVSPVYSMNTSRGCPHRCNFCSCTIISGNVFRSFSPGRIADEVQHLVTRYGAKGIYFREDCFTADARRVMEICRVLKERGIRIHWVCESRVDVLREEMIREMSSAGCRTIWFGVESGSDRVLSAIARKNTTVARARETFALCKKYGIKTGASLLIGMPGETRREMYETLDFVDELDPYWAWFMPYRCIPGSPLYDTVMGSGQFERINKSGTVYVKTDEFDEAALRRITLDICRRYFFRRPRRLVRYVYELLRTGSLIKNVKSRYDAIVNKD